MLRIMKKYLGWYWRADLDLENGMIAEVLPKKLMWVIQKNILIKSSIF